MPRTPQRWRALAAWLAVVALLIDGLLPTAVAAATARGTQTPPLLCGAGESAPSQPAPSLPVRHCALCVGHALVVLPPAPGGFAARSLVGAAPSPITPTPTLRPKRPDYAAPQPRAPPIAA